MTRQPKRVVSEQRAPIEWGDTTLTVYPGIRETTHEQMFPRFKTFERWPEGDVFLINDEYVSREEFDAKARELGARL